MQHAARTPPALRPTHELKGEVLEFKRKRVLECARDLFFAQGYAATTLRDISASLNVNKPFLYGLYPNKAEILAAVCELGLTEALVALDDVMTQDLPTRTKLESVVRRVTATVIRHRKCFVVYQRDEMNLTRPAQRRLHDLRNAFDRRLAAIVARGYHERVLTDGEQAITAATAGAFLLWVAAWYTPERTSESEAVEYMAGLFGRATGSIRSGA